MILCDAGVLLCLVDRTQPQHNAYRNAILRLSLPLVTTWSCLTEAMYLALHRGGWRMQKQLGQLLLDKLLTIHEIQESDYSRLWELMEQYQDRMYVFSGFLMPKRDKFSSNIFKLVFISFIFDKTEVLAAIVPYGSKLLSVG